MTTDRLFEQWQCLSCELGDQHPDTIAARKAYFDSQKKQK